jgi:hypothetical protein
LYQGETVRASDDIKSGTASMLCPLCGGAVVISYPPNNVQGGGILWQIPSPDHEALTVDHLPESVDRYFGDALKAQRAGIPDAAAVQLRRTLEAAAKEVGIEEKTLYKAVEKMIEDGLLTTQFRDVLTHVRRLGNLGAHATDERIDDAELARAMKFTTQVLRNLFEIPAELAAIGADAPEPTDS